MNFTTYKTKERKIECYSWPFTASLQIYISLQHLKQLGLEAKIRVRKCVKLFCHDLVIQRWSSRGRHEHQLLLTKSNAIKRVNREKKFWISKKEVLQLQYLKWKKITFNSARNQTPLVKFWHCKKFHLKSIAIYCSWIIKNSISILYILTNSASALFLFLTVGNLRHI